MVASPKVFISFSSKDYNEVQTLFYTLRRQGVEPRAYSQKDPGLPLGRRLESSIKDRIDSSNYFIALITPNSVDPDIGRFSRFEVLYALSSGKLEEDKILPIVLSPNGEWPDWRELYPTLEPIKRIELPSLSSEDFEDYPREICEWLSINYLPLNLKNKKIFFTEAFQKETGGFNFRRIADYALLMDIMDSCAGSVEKGDWETAKDKADLFLKCSHHCAPGAAFLYPLIIRGVCELELNEPEAAKSTFLKAISDKRYKNNPLYGLGFAGLGHTLFIMRKYDEALSAFQEAARFMTGDKYLLANQLDSMIQSGSDLWDDTVLDDLDLTEFPEEYHSKFLKIQGIAKYKKNKFVEAARIFESIGMDNLDEAAAIYYAMSLQEVGAEEAALDVILRTTERIKSAQIYQFLADCHLRCGHISEAFSIYRDILCSPDRPDNWKREYFVEYARLLKNTEDKRYDDGIQSLCERVLNFDLLSFPRSREDFFYLGFANYLLGRAAEARLDYERSAGFSEYFYDEILAR